MRNSFSYTRIEDTEDGGSRFATAELVLADQVVAVGVPPMAVGAATSAPGARFVRSAGFASSAHPAPARQWVLMLRGVIEVTTDDGAQRRFGPGDVVLAADTRGRGHVTVGIGEPPFEALFVPAPDEPDARVRDAR